MNISYIGSGLSPFGEAMTPKEQRELQESAATSTGSRISFVGHSPNFAMWVFNVNGKELVARNLSTQSPLQLKFAGYWDKPTFTPINTSGFKITDSTATSMIWQWQGKQYTSSWKVISADIEDPEAGITLWFGPPVPYTGPARAPVGNEVKTTPPVQGGGDTQTRRTQTGGGIYPSGGWNDFPQPTPTPTPTPAPEPAKGDLLSLAIKLGSVYMLLK